MSRCTLERSNASFDTDVAGRTHPRADDGDRTAWPPAEDRCCATTARGSRSVPPSAGADPGPACYRRGGPLTVTDANVCVGKLQPHHFPSIFGPHGEQSRSTPGQWSHERFAALAADVGERSRRSLDPANSGGGISAGGTWPTWRTRSSRCRWRRGRDVRRFALQCFGGAGGQHACLVADELGIETVLVHPLAGVLSAYGMGLADRSLAREQAIERPLEEAVISGVANRHRSDRV